jgi:hypothetical protein
LEQNAPQEMKATLSLAQNAFDYANKQVAAVDSRSIARLKSVFEQALGTPCHDFKDASVSHEKIRAAIVDANRTRKIGLTTLDEARLMVLIDNFEESTSRHSSAWGHIDVKFEGISNCPRTMGVYTRSTVFVGGRNCGESVPKEIDADGNSACRDTFDLLSIPSGKESIEISVFIGGSVANPTKVKLLGNDQ